MRAVILAALLAGVLLPTAGCVSVQQPVEPQQAVRSGSGPVVLTPPAR
jgi:hypothetical protein